MDPVLTVENLRVHFFLDQGAVRAVDDISFSVAPGRTLGVVGESGSGKSVLGQAIMRIVPPPGRIVAGKILLRLEGPNGSSSVLDLATLDAMSRQARRIRGAEVAMIFQEPMNSFSPVHTVGNQIVEALALHSDVSKAEARNQAIETLKKVGIPQPEHRFRAYPHELSGGMRQRAMIAMALVCRPKLLIADEPTTALDVTIQAQILDLLRSLQDELGMAILFISHNLGVISEISHEVMVVYFGRVMEHAPKETLFENPLHPYTKALLKSIPGIDTPVRAFLATIEGTLPDAHLVIPGCPFFWRCADCKGDITCRDDPYQLTTVSERHFVACPSSCVGL
ncbi:MAG: ABC transporter ATP-binding protein [Thermodesulfobacteriota bacterium]